MSWPRSRSKLPIHALNLSRSSTPSRTTPTLVTRSSCWWSPPSSERKSGSMATTRDRSNARSPSSRSSGTTACEQGMMSARRLSPRSRAVTSARCSSVTRSVLLSRIRSANTTCSTLSFSTPSGLSSSRCWMMCLASTTVRMASRRACDLMVSSMKKVCATGAGSARPVVSMRTASSLVCRLKIFPRIRMRSPRTVQQIHPLFISNISSSVSKRCFTNASSTPTSPNSFSITAILSPCGCDKIWFRSVVLPDPR
mmetsp:Transcript_28792/g.75632  ORF Transcript_28792/g.75632 Transcript_28792/m.75632 type:complete len:254 (-) Transcript_28792:48-809(-)